MNSQRGYDISGMTTGPQPQQTASMEPLRGFGSMTLAKTDHQADSKPSGSTVVRVRGLPVDVSTAETITRNVILRYMNEQIDYEICIISSCERSTESIALIDFTALPKFLASLRSEPLGSWQVTAEGEDLSFDRHFIGFTQLFDPVGTIQADVIALAGIDGHAYGSWRSRGALRRMWLRHFLCKDFPSCRVLIYGYSGKLSERNFASADDYATEFIEILKTVREQSPTRPIIFIAHSFGGLILARAIVRARQLEVEPAAEIIRGIFFFAVPHQGIDIEDMGLIFGADDHPRANLIKNIGIGAAELRVQLRDFKRIIKNTKVVSFYETQQSRRLLRDEAGNWSRTGDYFTSLQADNAVLNLPDVETRIPLHQDHSNVVKFDSRSDPGYKATEFHLQAMIKDIDKQSTHPDTLSGREVEMKHLKNWFINDEYECLAIIGLGGIGKSQLALAFCYMVKSMYPHYSIFWTSASSKETFRQGFLSIAKHSSMPPVSPGEDTYLAVKEYLSDEISGRWLLVIDNADDTELFDGSEGSIANDLPHSDDGKILFTSRHRDAITDVVDRNLLSVTEMSVDEAEAFLKVSLPGIEMSKELETSRQLLEELAYLPLAIVQASSYMVKKSMTIADYLKAMQSTDSEKINLLSQKFFDKTRDRQSYNAIAVTWLVSFEQIKKDDPQALDLLFYLACVESKSIPFLLLPPETTDGSIGTLVGYSFLTRHTDGDVYDMHRLVHYATKIWTHEDTLLKWREKAIARLVEIYPGRDWKNRFLWRELLPHAIQVLQDSEKISTEKRAKLCSSTAFFLSAERRLPEAIKWMLGCIAWQDESLNEADPKRIYSQAMLLELYRANGDVSKSEAILQQLSRFEDEPSYRAQPEKLVYDYHRANHYIQQNEIQKGIELLTTIVSSAKSIFGEEEDSVLTTFEEALARAYLQNDDIEQCIDLLTHVLSIRRTSQTDDDPSRMRVLGGLANAYLEKKDYQKAIDLLEPVVPHVSGPPEDTKYSRSMCGQVLGEAYLEIGYAAKAVAILEEVLEAGDVLGEEDNWRLLVSEQKLAEAYMKEDQIDQAIQHQEHVVSARRRTLNANHPDLIQSRMHLYFYRKKRDGTLPPNDEPVVIDTEDAAWQ